MTPELIEEQLAQLRTKWPQAHREVHEKGSSLIIVPTVRLPTGYNCTLCTVLFQIVPGYPWFPPENFYTDNSKLYLDPPRQPPWQKKSDRDWFQGSHPHCTNTGNKPYLWPQWQDVTWWSWKLQAWNPQKDTLMTYMRVIMNRLNMLY